ncbi:MAG: hypothetical protein MI867_01345 [Pseudomonadales bacterium]|nr:hypothetical protein [Pseudomonadales bacterium]
MRLILSRKGFDSSAGGCPNPIFPDGRLFALPIPDDRSTIQYKEIAFEDIPVGRLVHQLTKARVKGHHGAHLDPDLLESAFERQPGWRPLLGQTGSAQGHLQKQQVQQGDVFLFFGLFRPVELFNRKWRFVPGAPSCHHLWGWLQIGEIKKVDSEDVQSSQWLKYHPHLQVSGDEYNTLYIADDKRRKSAAMNFSSGIFPTSDCKLTLTAADSSKPSYWQLPSWFYPQDKPPLSYHHNLSRWDLKGGDCFLQSAARGQEFVLDLDFYPDALPWLKDLIARYGRQNLLAT